MEFKDVTIDDRLILSPFLNANKYGVCDFSFSNLFIWRHRFKAAYCIHKDYLIILSSTFDGVPHFFMPLTTSHGGNLKAVMEDIIEYSAKRFGILRMLSLTPEMIAELQEAVQGRLTVKDAEVWDYIYSAEALITLKGKKLHQKRNHIHKFDSLYSCRYIDLTPAHMPMCRDMLELWLADNDATDPGVQADKKAAEEALSNFSEIGFTGGGLIVDGRLAAFSLGQPINDRMFVVNIEKALYEYSGIYAKINQQFAAHNCGDFLYINREEDMGVEGLRKAKMSYRPEFLLYKHAAFMEV